jgi:hypothetical protein
LAYVIFRRKLAVGLLPAFPMTSWVDPTCTGLRFGSIRLLSDVFDTNTLRYGTPSHSESVLESPNSNLAGKFEIGEQLIARRRYGVVSILLQCKHCRNLVKAILIFTDYCFLWLDIELSQAWKRFRKLLFPNLLDLAHCCLIQLY